MIRTPAEEALLKALGGGHGEEPGWLTQRRRIAEDLFRQAGLPSRRVEAFKYTDLRGRLPGGLRPAEPSGAGVAVPKDMDALAARRMVFLNGFFRPDLSDLGDLPAGVRLMTLRGAFEAAPDALEAYLGRLEPGWDLPTLALNTALWTDGLFLDVAAGARLDAPLHVVYAADGPAGAASHARALIRLGPGAKAVILESHAGEGAETLSHLGTEIILDEGAELTRTVLQTCGAKALHLSETVSEIAGGARYHEGVLTLGASLSRHESHAFLRGPHARADLVGAYALDGSRLADHTLYIKHAAPDCDSRQLYKGAIADKARSVFQGKFFVEPVAQRTDAYQLNQALLLDERAEINSKPELEIYADDVKCSHGATAGALDEDALFYLRSRGVSRGEAEALLTDAFLAEAIEATPEIVREAFTARTSAWLGRRGARASAREAA